MTTFLIVAGVLVTLGIISAPIIYHFDQKRYKKAPRDTSYTPIMARRKKRLTRLNETAQHGQIVLLGDSITEFYPVDKYFHPPIKIYNRGICSDTTDRMVTRLDDNALCIEPRAIFILAGVNDIEKLMCNEETLANLGEMIDRAQERHIEHIYLESIYPINKSFSAMSNSIRTNERIIELNAKIAMLCSEKGVTYIDIFSHLTDDNGDLDSTYTNDGIHPNANGYKYITNLLMPYIDDVLSK